MPHLGRPKAQTPAVRACAAGRALALKRPQRVCLGCRVYRVYRGSGTLAESGFKKRVYRGRSNIGFRV